METPCQNDLGLKKSYILHRHPGFRKKNLPRNSGVHINHRFEPRWSGTCFFYFFSEASRSSASRMLTKLIAASGRNDKASASAEGSGNSLDQLNQLNLISGWPSWPVGPVGPVGPVETQLVQQDQLTKNFLFVIEDSSSLHRTLFSIIKFSSHHRSSYSYHTSFFS